MVTVTISMLDIFGHSVGCEAVFTPSSTPYALAAGGLVVSGTRSLTLARDGTGSVELAAGNYTVRFVGLPGGYVESVKAGVPADGGPYRLVDLMAGTTNVPAAPSAFVTPAALAAELEAAVGTPTNAGRALLTAADAAAQRVELGLGGPEVWPLFEKHYFTYDPDADNAGPALLAQLKASCRGPNPPYVIPPEFSAFTTATSHYPLFAIMWGDNADLCLLMTPAGNPIPCVIGMATLNGDLNLAGVVDYMSAQALTYYLRAQMLAGDLNGDGVVDSGDFAYLTELSAN